MNNRLLMIKQLDKQLKEWKAVNEKYARPEVGWVKTLRTAFNMTAEQLAKRLGLTRARIAQLENAEIHNAITLRSLQEAADAMGCELIYAIVPKASATLESIVKKRAAQIANERVASVAHSMSLEAQSVNADILKNQKEELSIRLVENLNKKLWTTLERSPASQKNKYKKLIARLKKKR